MPGSVRDLKTRLLEAIDQEGNVINMEILCEVVTALETTQLTAEDLHVTRLGKFVNLARRKATDRSLSKRLKNLVKRWQKLLQGGPSNGQACADSAQCAPPPPPPPAPTLSEPDVLMRISTPLSQASSIVTLLQTPVVQRSTTPCPTSVQSVVTTSHSGTSTPSVPTSAPPAPSGSKNDAIFNRRQKLQMLSQVNKRPPAISSSSGVSTNTTHPVKSEAIDADQDRGITTGTTPVIRGTSAAFKSSLADNTCTEDEGLVIRIPLVAVIQKAFSKHPPTGANSRPSSPFPDHTVTSPIEQVIQDVALPYNNYTPNVAATPFVEHTLSLVVSIDTSRLAQSAVTSAGETTIRRPQDNAGVPMGCVPGIDGHVGQDGSWYDWTKAMPPMDGTTVTVLPYVYVDGWDMADQ
eukprot:Em0011g1166a